MRASGASLACLLVTLVASPFLLLANEAEGAVGGWGNHKIWGLNYDPQKDPPSGGYCGFTEASIEADLRKISEHTERVRIYSLLGCDIGRIILQKAQLVGLKVWLGMWVGKDGGSAIQREIGEFQRLLDDQGLKNIVNNIVEGVIVGSEALYRGDVTENELIGYINQVRSTAQGRGVSVSIATADVVVTDGLVQAVDVIMQNNFPYWAGYGIDGVADTFWFLTKRARELASRYGKQYIVGETGWPSQGKPSKPDNPGNSPSTSSQNRYLNDITCRLNVEGVPFLYFQAFDMTWDKNNDPGGLGVEKSWGIYNAQRSALNSWIQLPNTCSRDPSPPSCSIEDGYDFVGADIKNVQVGSAELCCGVCQGTAGCVAFVWSTYGSGTCYLKSAAVEDTSKGFNYEIRRGKVSAGPPPPSPSSCANLLIPTDFAGNDVGSSKSSSASDCCGACSTKAGCFAFTWTSYEGGTCWLKSVGSPAATTYVPGAFSAPVCPGGIEEGVDFVGADVGSQGNVPKAEFCCGLCSQKEGCGAFTWLAGYQGGTCFFKSAAVQRSSNSQCRSAVVRR